VQLTSTEGHVRATDVAAEGDIHVDGAAGVEVGTADSASCAVALASAHGDVAADTVSAGAVAMVAPRSVTARLVRAGQSLQIEAQRVNAGVQATGSADVGASVTGYGGAMASDVQLVLSTPQAFRFTDLFSSTGHVDMLSGDLFIDALWVSQRMTLSNPMTRVAVDQGHLQIQPVDVQLYSAGAPFVFSLTRNRVSTSALPIYRSPRHEVLAPSGNNLSAAEAADREHALQDTLPPPYAQPLQAPQETVAPGHVVTYVGTPVRTEADCEPGAGPSDNLNCE
jgi:hypothetical protein